MCVSDRMAFALLKLFFSLLLRVRLKRIVKMRIQFCSEKHKHLQVEYFENDDSQNKYLRQKTHIYVIEFNANYTDICT